MRRVKSGKIVFIIILTIIAAICLGIGCGGQTDQTIKTLKIKNKVNIMSLGDVYTFMAETEGINGETLWSSDNSEIISITREGKATALKAGSATITLSAEELTDSVTVRVSDEDVPVLNKNKSDDVVLYKGNMFNLQPYVTFKGERVTDSINYEFVSDDETVATVSEEGKVVAVDIGECEISVSAVYRFTALSAIYKVRVVDGNFVVLSANEIALSMLDYEDKISTATLVATVYKDSEEVSDPALMWESSDNGVVTVNDGVLSAISAGEAVITVKCESLTNSCKVTVGKPVIDTGLIFDYEALNEVVLPEYEITDFNASNITEIIYGGKDVYKNNMIDKDLCIGSPDLKALTVVTQKAEYKVNIVFYNKIVRNVSDLENITASLAKLDVDPNNKSAGKYYDGYVVIDADIEYNGSFHPIAHGSDCAPDGFEGVFYTNPLVNGFRGEIDGKGHTISGLVIDVSYGGFVGAMNDGSYMHDLNLEDVTVKSKLSGGVTSMIYGNARFENIFISGKLDLTDMTFINSYEASGLFSNSIGNTQCSFNNCVVFLTEPFDLTNPSKQRIAVFGYGYTNTDYSFSDSVIIGTDRLYGYCPVEDAANVENAFEIGTAIEGVTLYDTFMDYEIAMALQDGFSKDEILSSDATCIESGKIVLKKAGEEDKVFILPALGHDFDDEGKCRRPGCSVQVMSKVAEADVKDGFDFKTLNNGVGVETVQFEGYSVPNNNGIITFANEDASLIPREYLVTYSDGNIADVMLTVYSVLISNESELRAAHEYQTVVTDKYGSKVGGYFKLDNDIIMTDIWKKDDMFGYVSSSWVSGVYGFIGLIDGNGKTITGLEINGAENLVNGNGFIYVLAEGGEIRDLTFADAKMNISGGCNGGFIAAHAQGGKIENVKITVSYPEGYTEGDPVSYARAGGVLLGEIGRNSENRLLTITNVTVIAADEATGSRLYTSPLGCKKDSAGVVDKTLIQLNNVKFVGFDTLMVWEGGERITTVDGLMEYITCNDVVSMSLEEYEASLI